MNHLRGLVIPEDCCVINGSKHLKIFREGKLIRIISRGTRKLQGPWLRYANRELTDF